MLDVENLKFTRSAIAASAILCLIEKDVKSGFATTDIERVSGMSSFLLESCIDWIQYCLNVEPQCKAPHVRQAVLESSDIPPRDFNSVQRHNTQSLKLAKDGK